MVLLTGCSGKPGQQNDAVHDEEGMSRIKLADLNGQPVSPGQYKGKTVFINFWATWCKPCLQEMPSIENAQAKLYDQHVIFLAASNEEPEQIEEFMMKHEYHFHYVRLENMEELNIQALPTTYIFNPEGKLKFAETGYRRWDDPENIELITRIINDHEK